MTTTSQTTRQTPRKTTRAQEKNDLVAHAMTRAKQRIEKRLNIILQARAKEKACEPLLSAMHEGLLAGGKRMRPFLLFASADLAENLAENSADAVALKQGAKHRPKNRPKNRLWRTEVVEDAAAALEMIHCYSLIHDDLPAMDNDLLRRGEPTLHVKVGCGQAILAGDALLTLAFEVLAASNEPSPNAFSNADAHSEARLRLSLCFDLARAAGAQGMAGGQSWDLQSEQQPERHATHEIHALKTGALLRAACAMGARCFDADERLQKALHAYASDLGNAYQAIDDLRDEADDNKRHEQQHATLPLASRTNIEATREAKRKSLCEEAIFLCRRAERALEDEVEKGKTPALLLGAFAHFLPSRIPQTIPQEAA